MAKEVVVVEDAQAKEVSAAVKSERKALKRIREEIRKGETTFSVVRQLLLEFDEREGWHILGYPSLASCIRLALGIQKSHTYTLIAAARVHRNILTESTLADDLAEAAGKRPISANLLRPIVNAELKAKDQQRVYKQAMDFAARDSKTDQFVLKPKHIKEAIVDLTGSSAPSLSEKLTRKDRLEKLRSCIDKAIGLADLLAVPSKVVEHLTAAQRAIDE